MCGIIGYTGNKDATDRIIYGLKKLEYRGYDSAGVAVEQNGKLVRYRSKGKIAGLEHKIKGKKITGSTGIGHTRWATHGKPSEENAHPHVDCTKKITVVHNGIMENYAEIKEKLKKKGHKFTSETDSEVFAHLIEDNISKGLYKSVEHALKIVKGFFAITVINADEPGRIIASRNGSPLVIGIGTGENYIASDVTSFLKYTKKAIFVEDGDICIVDKDEIEIRNKGQKVRRKITEIKWNHKQAEKAGYPHFMLKEIHEEPEAFEDTILGRFDEDKGNINFDGIKIEKLKKIINISVKQDIQLLL
jgi:glucosamine--fructose-6-phosphate aminotransferase (isomerizing)